MQSNNSLMSFDLKPIPYAAFARDLQAKYMLKSTMHMYLKKKLAKSMHLDLQKHALWSAKLDPENQDLVCSWLEPLLRALLVAAGLKLCTWKYALFYNHIIHKLLLHFVELQRFHSTPKMLEKSHWLQISYVSKKILIHWSDYEY